MIHETMKDVCPQKPSNLSKELSYHHDACVHSEFSICPSGHREKEAIHQSRRPTPKTSSSLEPSRHRSEKQLVGIYVYIYIYGDVYTPIRFRILPCPNKCCILVFPKTKK
jgi:hypothetical protein